MASTLSSLNSTWDLHAPFSIRLLAEGSTNNSVYLVETSAGSRYVVRLYLNQIDSARLNFEHAVLAGLQGQGLSFAVPLPIPTRTGELYGWVSTDEGQALTTVSDFLPGLPPLPSDLAQATAAGEALGELDRALARLEMLDSEAVSWRSYGDLQHCHPLVPDPAAAMLQLPVATEVQQQLLARYHWLLEQVPMIYSTLPQQLSHEDYAPLNILMEREWVTGVLDFEFCCRDLRVMDLTVALSWWPNAQFGTGEEWPIIDAFARGYARRCRLMGEEIDAIPVVYELRSYTSLIHRLGRYRQGLSSMRAVVDRAHAALTRRDWMVENGSRLIERLGSVLVALSGSAED
jgi:homoserine kinase type II